MNITIDGVTYTVGIASVKRSYRREYKYQVMTEDGVTHSEIRASYVDFSLSLGNVSQSQYDTLMAALFAATGDVTVTMPKDSTTTEAYTGQFEGVSDEIICDDGTTVTWDNLTLSFSGTVPVTVEVST